MLSSDQTQDYLRWTSVAQQSAIEAQAGACQALFHHTTPLYVGSAPWIFHYESFPSLFMPFMMAGSTAGSVLKGHGWFERVRAVLASSGCRAIITHMKSSRAILDRVMDSAAISAKLHHAPLGIEAPKRARVLDKFDRPGPLRILFTNSLHQNPSSFYLRGGHHLLRAFSQLRQDGLDVDLTVLSSLPGDLAAYFSDRDLAGVRWIAGRVDDAALEQLLLTHHLFALPAAGLHSYSVLRALSHGCVPIVSDALGYEEYTDPIQDSVFIVRGVREMVYRDEPEGWVSERYEPFVRPSLSFSSQIYQAVARCGGLWLHSAMERVL
jgi:glycosyltransferase involved in cell wall biosynthesis